MQKLRSPRSDLCNLCQVFSLYGKTYVKPHRWAARMASYVVQYLYIVYYLKSAIFALSSIDTVSRQLSNRGSYDIRKSRSRLARGLFLSRVYFARHYYTVSFHGRRRKKEVGDPNSLNLERTMHPEYDAHVAFIIVERACIVWPTWRLVRINASMCIMNFIKFQLSREFQYTLEYNLLLFS